MKENRGTPAAAVQELLGKLNLTSSHIGAALERYDGGLHYEDTFIALEFKSLLTIDAAENGILFAFAKDMDGR